MNMYERISKGNNYNNSVLADIINSSELGNNINHIQFDFDHRKSIHKNHGGYNGIQNCKLSHPSVGNYTIYSSSPLTNEDKSKVNKKITSLAEQYLTQSKYNDNFKHAHYLIGVSRISRKIYDLILKSSISDAPVLIYGATGTEKLAVASSIHFSSARQDLPFIEVNCSTIKEKFDQEISQLAESIEHGTLFLSEIDCLTISQQNRLLSLLSNQANGVWEKTALSHGLRIISSCSTTLTELIQDHDFNPFLARKLDFLTIHLPRLNQRREDIPTIIRSILLNSGIRGGEKISIAPSAMRYLREFNWHGDSDQLHRSIIQIATFRKSNTICLEDIKSTLMENKACYNLEAEEQNNHSIIHYIFNKEFEKFKHLHGSVQKAIVYLSEHFKEGMTLNELAKHSFISPSHLTYLLRHNLDRTFKQILIELRIESAKKSFRDYPQLPVTQVSLDSGFNDLSNFEKTFKKYTSLTPRQYKNQHREKINNHLRTVNSPNK
ncbi:sigma 54-interacting transcriptional regulator [Vibrio maritimus]